MPADAGGGRYTFVAACGQAAVAIGVNGHLSAVTRPGVAVDSPVPLQPGVRVTDCATDGTAAFAVTDDGSALLWPSISPPGVGTRVNLPGELFERCFGGFGRIVGTFRSGRLWVRSEGKVTIIDQFCTSHIIHIACAATVMYVLTEDGTLYVQGTSIPPVLTGGATSLPRPVPCERTLGKRIAWVSATPDLVFIQEGYAKIWPHPTARPGPIGAPAGTIGSFKVALKAAGPSGAEYELTAANLGRFGFRAGERVKHAALGYGFVRGTWNNKVFIEWESDGKISSTISDSPVDLHEALQIVGAAGRQERRAGGLNIETGPCGVLASYGIAVGDTVRFSGGCGGVLGEFTLFAVIQNFQTGEVSTVPPFAIELIGREGPPLYVTKVTEDQNLVDVDVGFTPQDEFRPGDRISTPSDSVTVVGKGPNGLWVQTDRNTRRGLGIVQVTPAPDWRLVRRLSPALSQFGAGFLPGDIVTSNGKVCTVVATEAGLVISDGGDDRAIDETVRLQRRPDLPATVDDLDFSLVLDVGSEGYRGIGVFPGDTEGSRLVLGLSDDVLWGVNEGGSEAVPIVRPREPRPDPLSALSLDALHE